MCATRQTEIADGLEVLHDATAPPSDDLPLALRRIYGGGLGLDGPRVYANFVSSVDGVVALEMAHSPGVISQRSRADRFVMGLLRARADAVLIGGGTFRSDPGHAWTPGYIHPEGADDFREMRRMHGQPDDPKLVIVTGRGELDPRERALEGALVVTTDPRSRRQLPSSTEVRVVDEITAPALIGLLRDEGLGLILSEAGPRLLGELVSAVCLDDLFLTVSPLLAGSAAPGRKTLSEGMALSDALATMDLLSVRREQSHLFLRYTLTRS